MTAFGQYGGTHYQTPIERGLGSITVESYEKVYDDQAKFMSKLAGDVSYLASNDKKQQAGIDQANENFIQQFQDMINDVIVLLGGGGDTGFDFGDLRYVIIAIGALFGFTDGSGKINVPLNLFQAAWHFFANYLLPVDNFKDAIDTIIDEAIATVLDIFGEVPIVGQALEQFAVIVSDIRDIVDPLFDAFQAFLSIFTIDIGSSDGGVSGINNYFGPLKPIFDMLGTALDGINLPDFAGVFHKIALWTEPFTDNLATIIEALVPMITETVTLSGGLATPVIQFIDPLVTALSPYIDQLVALVEQLNPILDAIVGVINMFTGVVSFPDDFDPTDAVNNFINNFLNPSGILTAIIDPSSTINASQVVGTLLASVIPNLDASKLTTGTLLSTLIPALGSGWGKTIDSSLLINAISQTLIPSLTGTWGKTIASSLLSGILGSGLIPGLDASKIIGGVLALATIPGLPTSKITSGTFLSSILPMFGLMQGAGSNLVIDPSFESTAVWNNGSNSGVQSTDFAHSGTTSRKITGNGTNQSIYLNSNDAGLSPRIKTSPGEVYRIGAWIYPAAANVGTGGINLMLNTFNGAGTFLANPGTTFTLSTLTKGAWNYIEAVITEVAGASSFNPMVYFLASVPAGEVYYVDDVLVREETQSQNIIQKLFGGNNILTSILAAVVPALDASKLTTGTLLTSLLPVIPNSLLTGLISAGTILTSLLPNIPNSLLTGILSGGLILGSLIPNLDASKIVSGIISVARVPWAAQIDTLVQAWGGTGSNFLPADLATFASGINPTNILGNLGGTNIADTIQNLLDGGVGAVQNNQTLANQTIAQWNNALSAAMGFLGWNPAGPTPPNSVAAIASNSDATLKGRAIQKNIYENIDPTIDATFPFSDVYTSTTLPTIAVTQANPVSAPLTVRDGGIKQSIRWKGYVSSGTLSGFYVNLYWVNKATGVWTWFYSTTNYATLLATGSAPQWNSFNIPAAPYINANAGDTIQAEIVVTGTGTYTMVGKTLSNQLLPMSGVYPAMPAAQRLATTPPTYISSGSFTGTNGASTSITVDQRTSDTGAIFLFRLYRTTNAGAGGITVGGVAATSVGGGDNFFLQAGSQSFWCEMFYVRNPPAGAQTISSAGGTGVTHTNIGWIQLTNVGTISGFAQGNATSANPTNAMGAGYGGPNALALVGFADDGGTVTGTTGFTNSTFSAGAYSTAFGTVGYSASAQSQVMQNSGSAQWGVQECAVAGIPAQPTTGMTVANPSAPGTTGVPAAYNRIQPWIGLAGTAGTTSYSPVVDPYSTPGSGISIQNPAVKYPWANNFDVIMCSDGSGGEGGGYPVGGVGGKAGTWIKQTLTRAQMGTSNLTLNIGGGSPGTGPGVGSSGPGGGVSVVIPGFGTVSQPGAPGSGSGLSPSAYGVAGDSSGNFSYTDANGTDVQFAGGAGGSGGQAPGGQPGGGGSGGNSTYMPNFNGGPGGAAEVLIRSYQ